MSSGPHSRFAFVLLLVLACAAFANAQSAQMQNSTLTGSGNVLNITQLPALTSSGTFVYWNVVIQFTVASDGSLTISKGYPKFTPTPQTIDDGFLAGTYLGPDDSTELISVTGPGVDPSGATVWQLQPGPGYSGCLFPYMATWYDVGTNLKNNTLLYPRLKNAGITSTMLQYGTGSANCGSADWNTSSLLGFSQTPSGLTITSFTYDGKDQNTPVDLRTYQKQP